MTILDSINRSILVAYSTDHPTLIQIRYTHDIWNDPSTSDPNLLDSPQAPAHEADVDFAVQFLTPLPRSHGLFGELLATKTDGNA